MCKEKLTAEDIIQIIEKEIVWCKENALDSEDYMAGYIAGLIQVRYLIITARLEMVE